MNSDKKILILLKAIDNQYQTTPKGRPIIISQEQLIEELGLEADDVATLMSFLERNERSIEILKWPRREYSSLLRAVTTTVALFKQDDLRTMDSYYLRTLPKISSTINFYERKLLNKKLATNQLPGIEKSVGLFAVHEDGTISYQGDQVDLEPKQQKIAALLISNSPRVVPYEKLIDTYWKDEIESDSKSLDTKDDSKLIKNIHDSRSKLNRIFKSLDQKEHIKNTPGIGYKFLA